MARANLRNELIEDWWASDVELVLTGDQLTARSLLPLTPVLTLLLSRFSDELSAELNRRGGAIRDFPEELHHALRLRMVST